MRSVFFLCLLLPGLALGQCLLAPLDTGRVIHLSGAELPQALDKPLSSLSVMAWRDGDFHPVAFQLDELDEHGLVWFASTGFAAAGTPGQFNREDQLLLMLTDAGERAPSIAQLPQGQLLARLTVADNCHFYVVEDNPARSDRQYVHHDTATGLTRTALYQLQVDPDNELNWQSLGFHSYQGEGSIIDTLKMRMSAGVLSRFARMTLDNHNLRPRQTAFHQGPIRSVMHLRTRVVFAGIPVMTLQVQAMRYAAHYEAHSYARVPDLYRATLKDPEVAVSIDGHEQYGARVYTANQAVSPVVVSGEPSAAGEAFENQGITARDNWILFDSGRDFTLLTRLSLPDELQSLPIGLVYQDDAELKLEPEHYPGQLPNLGYVLRGWPDPQELRFSVSLYFEQGLGELSAAEFAEQRGAPVPVAVTSP